MHTSLITLTLLLLVPLFFTSPVFAQVVINEFNPDPNPEWVEFYNASSSAEYIKSYYIDDDADFTSDDGNKDKKVLTDLNTSSPTYPFIDNLSSFFNNDGDKVVLFDAAGTKIDEYSFSQNADNKTIGRSPDKTGNFHVLSSATKGSFNASPLPSASPNVNPSPSPTNNPSPTTSPRATPLVRPSPTVRTSPRARARPSPTAEASDESVLGAIDASPTPMISSTPEASASAQRGFPVGILLVLLGITISGVGGFIAYKKMNPQQ